MQNAHNEKSRVKKTFFISCLVLLFFSVIEGQRLQGLQNISHAKPIIYIFFFCLATFLFLVLFRSSDLRIRTSSVLFLIVAGQVISMLSLLFANALDTADGWNRIMNAIEGMRYEVILVLAYWSFFLGGWFLVPLCDVLASAIARIKLKRELP